MAASRGVHEPGTAAEGKLSYRGLSIVFLMVMPVCKSTDSFSDFRPTAQNYAVAGLVNMTPSETDYFFGDVPPSVESLKNYILIYKRNP